MKVLKFGGTSVGSVESILSLKQIVTKEAKSQPVVVVVSALGGITDKLIATSKLALAGDERYRDSFDEIVDRHHKMIDTIITDTKSREQLFNTVDALLEQLRSIYFGVFLIHDLSEKTQDAIVSYGERLSSNIVATLIKGAKWFDSRDFIKTERKQGKHALDAELTNKLVRQTFADLPRVSLVPGFISRDKDTNEVTNLGRGGSDYTAAIIAAALDADVLEIWTDVDGFMTADPRVIKSAYTINELSYIEAMELCNFGAKVIYPPTIFPVYHKNIPIIIKNTFNPSAPGTLISSDTTHGDRQIIKGISSINDTSLVTVSGLGMVGVIGVNKRIFSTLADKGISVFLVSQASSENSSTIGVKNADAERAVQFLSEEFCKEMAMGEISSITAEHDLATVAIVGEKMRQTPGIAGKLFRTLGLNGINVIACAQGASETNISFVTTKASLTKALNVIHDSFFLSEYNVLNIFLSGVGLVGRNLIEQINSQQAYLLKHKNLQLRIVGMSNSKKLIFDREGLDLNNWETMLKASETPSSPTILRDLVINENMFNAVFVDCTASSDIPEIYHDLLQHNISVVCANKVAASGDYDNYRLLKRTARKRGVKYLFETNVGAGLPIINTINNLINSGDEILEIEAVVSGTLNFIFNVLDKDVPMSKAIYMAREAGYAEPDPRMDLNGSDVIRKIVILSREAGYKISREDVEKHLFIPDTYFEGSVDEFWKRIPELDAHFEEMREKAAEKGNRFRFVASLSEGKAKVELREVDQNHPFYHLEGSNNIILLRTARYKEYPMEIKGYGAGAAVTAAGVFADIMSIANIR